MTECTMRRRSSSRCSRRLIPGSSARSDIAPRARSMRSTMVDRGLFAFGSFRARSVYGFVRGLLFFDYGLLVAGIDFRDRQVLVVWPLGGAYRLPSAGRLDRRRRRSCRLGRCRGLYRRFGGELGGFGLRFGCGSLKLLLPLLLLHGSQFLVDLHLEVVACAAELGEQLADLTAYFGKPFRPKEDQCQQEDKDGVAEVHLIPIMIPVRMDGSQIQAFYSAAGKVCRLPPPLFVRRSFIFNGLEADSCTEIV